MLEIITPICDSEEIGASKNGGIHESTAASRSMVRRVRPMIVPAHVHVESVLDQETA
jgi:hypothetical protein